MSDVWLAVLGGGGGATIVGVLNALFGKRGKEADATFVIEQSATSAVKRVEADNAALRERLEKVETDLEDFRKELRSRNLRIDDMSEELEDFREYSIDLRAHLQRQDPTLVLPEPPARIARHFLPP